MTEKEAKKLLKEFFKENPELNKKLSRKELDGYEDLMTFYTIRLIRKSFEKARKRRFPVSTERLTGYIIEAIIEMEEDGEFDEFI